tara:strand:+ start:1391 stop:2752 length:1362 start_codon:yes stop_codon:yes gene_type:complete
MGYINRSYFISNLPLILNGSILKIIWKLGFPNAIAWITWTLSTFADAIFLGYLGTKALAMIAIIFPFQMLMLMMAAGAIGGGITSSVGRAIGGKNIIKAELSCFHSILIGILMSFIYLIIFFFYSKNIFEFMGASNVVLNKAIIYSKILFSFCIFFWLTHVLSAILRGIGDTYTPSKVIIIGSLSQILFSYIFTFGINNLFEFGYLGPVISITICHFGMMLYLIYYLIFNQKVLKIRFHKISSLILKDIMKVGGLGLFNSMTIALTVGVVTGYIGNFGHNALAGYGIGARLELILTPVIFGIGAALTSSVSINFGSKQYVRAKKIAIVGGFLCFLIIGIIGLTVYIYPSIWVKNFSIDQEVINFYLKYIFIVTPFYCFFGLGQAIYFSSQGTGKMLKPIIVGIVRFLCVVIGGYLALFFKMPIDYILYFVALGLILTGIGMSLCLFGKEWDGN